MSQLDVIEKAQKHLGDEFQEIAWTTGIIALLLSPVTVIGNGFVLVSILLDPFKNIKCAPSSNLIFSLALADFIVGIFPDPMVAVWLINTVTNNSQPFSSSIAIFPATISLGVSLYSLVALSVDRRIAITTPLQYVYRVTEKKIRFAIICIWCYFLFAGILFAVLFSHNLTSYIILTAHFAIPTVIVVVINIAAIRSMHNQRLNIKRNFGSENSLLLQNAFNREKTFTQTVSIMVVAFEICLLPFVVLSSIADKILSTTNLHDYKTFIWFYFLSNTLLLSNSLVNPFLFAWRLPKYRKAFQCILNKLKKKLFISQVQPQSNSSLQLPVITHNHVTLYSLNPPSLVQRDNNMKILRQEAVSCSNTRNEVDVQDCINNEGHKMEDARL